MLTYTKLKLISERRDLVIKELSAGLTAAESDKLNRIDELLDGIESEEYDQLSKGFNDLTEETTRKVVKVLNKISKE